MVFSIFGVTPDAGVTSGFLRARIILEACAESGLTILLFAKHMTLPVEGKKWYALIDNGFGLNFLQADCFWSLQTLSKVAWNIFQ